MAIRIAIDAPGDDGGCWLFGRHPEVATPGATLYTRCDNLSEITVD